MEKEAVLNEALALPKESRAEVATKLIESLGAPVDSMSDEEVIAEAQRRSDEMDRDPSCALTQEEFLNQFPDRRK